MKKTDILILNFEEVRRRSLKVWSALTPENYYWKPDAGAMGCLEMVRHVLESEHIYQWIIFNKGVVGNYVSPWNGRPYISLEDEINFAKPYREEFLEFVKGFTPEELDNVEIIRADKNQRRLLVDYLQRIAYHEAVHTGQLLGYLRTMGVNRPVIWD
jgi:uncharacterized damage-inducible protein DinB